MVYDLVQASSLQLLSEEVNKRLESGWELAGNFVTLAGPAYVQPMTTNKSVEQVKEDAKPKDLTDAQAHAEFLKQAESPANQAAMAKITGPTPIIPGLNEPMEIEVVATPKAEVEANQQKGKSKSKG